MSKILQETLLKDDKNRFVIFPVKHHDIWDWYKKMQSKFWTVHSNLADHQLEIQQQEFNENESRFLQNLLALLSGSQKIVTGNLTHNLKDQVNSDEAGLCLDFQVTTENVHFESFSLLASSLIQKQETIEFASDVHPQLKLIEAFSKKHKGAELLIASAATNAIFFSAGVSALLGLKRKEQLQGLSYYAQLISRDKTYHRDLVIALYLENSKAKISEEKIREIVLEIKGLSREFLTRIFPVDIIGMPTGEIDQYLDLVTKDLLKKLGRNSDFSKKTTENGCQTSGLSEKRADQLRKAAKKHNDKDSEKINSNADL